MYMNISLSLSLSLYIYIYTYTFIQNVLEIIGLKNEASSSQQIEERKWVGGFLEWVQIESYNGEKLVKPTLERDTLQCVRTLGNGELPLSWFCTCTYIHTVLIPLSEISL